MTVTGGIKFFEPSQNLFTNGARAFDMRGQNANRILNHSRDNGWVSVCYDVTGYGNGIDSVYYINKINSVLINPPIRLTRYDILTIGFENAGIIITPKQLNGTESRKIKIPVTYTYD